MRNEERLCGSVSKRAETGVAGATGGSGSSRTQDTLVAGVLRRNHLFFEDNYRYNNRAMERASLPSASCRSIREPMRHCHCMLFRAILARPVSH